MNSTNSHCWTWYAPSSPNPILLDSSMYPKILYDGHLIEKPSWVCQAPSGGLHIDPRQNQIDLHIAETPKGADEIAWLDGYSVIMVKRSWFDRLFPSVDKNKLFIGHIYLDGNPSPDWYTIHSNPEPTLLSYKPISVECSICGKISTWTSGGEYFSSKNVYDQKVLTNERGIFVSQDVIDSLNIRPPKGSFRPSLVKWKDPH